MRSLRPWRRQEQAASGTCGHHTQAMQQQVLCAQPLQLRAQRGKADLVPQQAWAGARTQTRRRHHRAPRRLRRPCQTLCYRAGQHLGFTCHSDQPRQRVRRSSSSGRQRYRSAYTCTCVMRRDRGRRGGGRTPTAADCVGVYMCWEQALAPPLCSGAWIMPVCTCMPRGVPRLRSPLAAVVCGHWRPAQ